MTMAPRLLAAALLAVSACTPAPVPEAAPTTTPPPAPAPAPDCGAGQLSGWVGQAATGEALAAIRAWRGDHPVRVLPPGAAMTMDYRPDRLNVFLDDAGRIDRFGCN